MAKKEIKGAVRAGGSVYTAGQEEELEKVLTAKDAERLTKRGVLAGDWDGKAKSK